MAGSSEVGRHCRGIPDDPTKPGEDFFTPPHNQIMHLWAQPATDMVRIGRCLFERSVSRDHLLRNQVLTNAEVLQ